MNEHTAVVLGASGLIGHLLVEELLKDDSFVLVRILVRRPLPIVHPKLKQEFVNFNDIKEYDQKFGDGDIIFSCIGTTQKNVKGDKTAYEKIDYDIPVNAARIGIAKNYKKFPLVSSVGADENSSNFYLRLKGKIEKAIKQFEFESISIFCPSMLLGERKEKRRGEKLLQGSMKFLSNFLFGPLKKYKAIQAKDVAKAMVKMAKQNKPGVHYLEYEEIINLSQN